MKYYLVKILICFQVTTAILSAELNAWNEYKRMYSKQYISQNEEITRKQIFQENLAKITEHNNRFNEKLETYLLGVNQFSDLDDSELLSRPTMPKEDFQKFPNLSEEKYDLEKIAGPLPSQINWVSKGAVTRVKNEGHCQSHWAFSAVGAVEGAFFMYGKTLKELSVQQVLDCDIHDRNCQGGSMINVYGYLSVFRAESEFYYPYRAIYQQCMYNPMRGEIPLLKRYLRPPSDLYPMMKVIAYYGPHSIAINDRPSTFVHYRSGVYNDPQCDSRQLNRGALLVGYGTEFGSDYWLIKNSWGDRWGEYGYIKILRSQMNLCGVMSDVTYPSFT